MLLTDMRPGLYIHECNIADAKVLIRNNQWTSPSIGLYLVLEIYEFGFIYVDIFSTSVYPERHSRLVADNEHVDMVCLPISEMPVSRFLMATSLRTNPLYVDNLGRRVC